MSDDPENLAADSEPLWAGWYAGPRRADGGPNRRLQLTREGQYVTLSVEELARVAERSPAVGSTSDGFHTFDELYEHRTVLLALLVDQLRRNHWMTVWKALQHADGTMFPGYFIVGVNTAQGDATYHCKREFWTLFDNVPELEFAPEFDGHTPADTINRLCMAVLGRPVEYP